MQLGENASVFLQHFQLYVRASIELTPVPCPYCGRRFATDRLAVHDRVCKAKVGQLVCVDIPACWQEHHGGSGRTYACAISSLGVSHMWARVWLCIVAYPHSTVHGEVAAGKRPASTVRLSPS
jgi:hypothetical protein